MNQKQVWNNIAEEWYEFKNEPSEFIIDFLKKQKGNVLDLGGGAGRFLINIKGGKMYLTDFSISLMVASTFISHDNILFKSTEGSFATFAK